MIINKQDKGFQTRSDKPNSFWLTAEPIENYFIIDDASELAQKIQKNYPSFDFVLDENGNLIDVTLDTEAIEKKEQLKELKNQILKLKKQLIATDYQAIKYAEGRITEEEFLPVSEQRQLWRNEINTLEAQIINLKA